MERETEWETGRERERATQTERDRLKTEFKKYTKYRKIKTRVNVQQKRKHLKTRHKLCRFSQVKYRNFENS
jgi:hypothetical protein